MNITELETKTVTELRDIARDWSLSGYTAMKKPDLIFRLLEAETERQGNIFSAGVLEIVEDGFGFLRRDRAQGGALDIYVSQTQIRRFGLRTGDMVSGQVRPPKENEKYFGLLRVEVVNGMDPEIAKRRPHFDTLTAIFPNEMFNLETEASNITGRLINLIAPIGRGQRGLIVAPPKAGKTILLKTIANSLTANYNDIQLMIALIGERPEEVTDMRRSVQAEVYSSTFDEPAEAHVRVAEMALERAKRLVESGKDVVLLLDSITRLTRAYNLAISPSGRTLSGGLDPAAVNPPKRFFGAGRNVEEGGSLTIIATVLVDTNSRMDDVIYEEFKGTGNMEITLDRKLSERRIFPAIDITRSSTRREEALLDENALRAVVVLRRMFATLAEQDSIEATDRLIAQMSKTHSNDEFLSSLNKSIAS
ncbi:MAG TPA: transcription termination factor Rho [Ktedonobacterales bacterium]|nr:transcription termination factor Rho [Ktedonobacterales bacterium]